MGCAVGEMRDSMVVYLLGNSQVYWVKTKPALGPLLLHLLPADFTEGQVLASAHSDITRLHSTFNPHKFNPSLRVLASSSFSPARSSSILRSVEILLPSCMFYQVKRMGRKILSSSRVPRWPPSRASLGNLRQVPGQLIAAFPWVSAGALPCTGQEPLGLGM